MTACPADTFHTQGGKSTGQVRELQRAIRDTSHKLRDIRLKRCRAQEDIVACTKESERRLDLIVENGEIVDMLQQVGHLLQKERELSEQLRGETPTHRCQYDDLQERTKCISNKERFLTAKIMEVKLALTEVKNRNAAAQALIHAPHKSKRNQRKPK